MTDNKPLLLHVFSTFKVGGTQVRTVQLIEALGEHYRHRIVAMDGNYDAIKLFANPETVDSLPPPVTPGGLLSRLFALRAWLKDQQTAKLFTYNWGSIEIAAAALLCPKIEHYHFEDGFGPDEAQRQLPRRVWFRRLSLLGAKKLVVPSRLLQNIAGNIWKIRKSKIQLIENGIDVAAFERSPDISLLAPNKAENEIWIGTIAGLRPEKRLDRLIRIFSTLQNGATYRLFLIGTGVLEKELKSLAKSLGIADRVIFPGFLEKPERYLRALDIFVMTSDTEQFPISLVEAMAAGRPAVCTAVGDIRSILGNEQQPYICDAGDDEALTEALKTLIQSPELREKLGNLNREKVKRDYDIRFMLEAYREIFS
ncbi:MAG: glycosyltransferase family 4 protein [Sphingomonadales bacterium]|jgi:glycosyltransferase involved in cell wall biosynthesis